MRRRAAPASQPGCRRGRVRRLVLLVPAGGAGGEVFGGRNSTPTLVWLQRKPSLPNGPEAYHGGSRAATARAAERIRPLGRITRHLSTSGRMSAAGRRDSGRRRGGSAAERCSRDREPSIATRPPAVRRFGPSSSRSCRLSFAVAFEHRLAHRAQREARVALAAMQVPFKTCDRRQVHRSPRVPVQRRGEARQPTPRPGWPPRLRRRSRCLTASRDGRCPPRDPPTGPGSPTRR